MSPHNFLFFNELPPDFDNGLAMIAVSTNSVFILLILTRASFAAVYVTFLLNCVAILIWNGGDFMGLASANPFWHYFSLIGVASIPAFMFHFINALVGSAKFRGRIITGYVLCLPLVFSSLLALWQPRIRPVVDGRLWDVWFLMLQVPYFAAGVFMLAKAIRTAKSRNERSRLRYILVAACIACFAGTIDLLRILPLGHLGW